MAERCGEFCPVNLDHLLTQWHDHLAVTAGDKVGHCGGGKKIQKLPIIVAH